MSRTKLFNSPLEREFPDMTVITMIHTQNIYIYDKNNHLFTLYIKKNK